MSLAIKFNSLNLASINGIKILAHFSHKFFKVSIVFLFVWISYPAISQTHIDVPEKSDTTKQKLDTASVYYFRGTIDSLRLNRIHYIDTTLTYYHQYNPDQHGNRMYGTLDNIGLPSYNRVFLPDLTPGYIFMPNSLDHILYSNNEVKYYTKLTRPYSSLHYVMGPQRQQDLGVDFDRKLAPTLTLGLRVWIVNSPGIYSQSFSKDNNVYFTGQYYTKNRRYGIIANYLYNQDRFQENGGLLYDSIFQLHQESDPSVIPVRLTNAENHIKTTGFYVEQYFNLSPPDSTSGKSKIRIDAGSVSYSFQYKRNYMTYLDNASDSTFYQNFPAVFDSLQTYDSVYQVLMRNTFKWSSLSYQDNKLSQVFHLSFGIHLDQIGQKLAYSYDLKGFSEATTFGNLSLWLFKRSYLDAHGQITFGGYNNGDFELKGIMMQYLGSQVKNIGRLRFGLQIINRMPAWYFSHYQSNRFNWNQELKKERFVILKGEYLYKGICLGARMQTLNNYTYFNDSVQPEQNKKTGTVLQLYGQGTIPLRSFGINFRGVYQTTSMGNCIHIPTFTGMLDLYFKNWIFSRHGKLQTGLQFSYFTKYYADAYMPELRSFYVQNNTAIGDYLMASVYLTLKVKTFRIFAKETNLRGLEGNYNYFSTPHYPDIAPGFFFGVTWRFHN